MSSLQLNSKINGPLFVIKRLYLGIETVSWNFIICNDWETLPEYILSRVSLKRGVGARVRVGVYLFQKNAVLGLVLGLRLLLLFKGVALLQGDSKRKAMELSSAALN